MGIMRKIKLFLCTLTLLSIANLDAAYPFWGRVPKQGPQGPAGPKGKTGPLKVR